MTSKKAPSVRTETSLFTRLGQRKYLTPKERKNFIDACQDRPSIERLFCLTLLWSGGRLSEVLALTTDQLSLEEGTVIFRTLKQRGSIRFRQVPLPSELFENLPQEAARPLPWGRTQAWAVVKSTMAAAEITGPQACPRGLRHSFAVHAITSGVPLHLVQRWLGHARLETTAIYANAMGAEERRLAALMWR